MRRRSFLAIGGTLAGPIVGGSVAEDAPELEIAFRDCTTVEITGSFDSLLVYHGYLLQVESMLSTLRATEIPRVTEPPFRGTVVYRIGEDDDAWVRADGTPVVRREAVVDWGSAINSVGRAGGSRPVANPYECLDREEFRPAPPLLAVENVTVVDRTTLEVAFRYENPYDDPLHVPTASSFDGTTDDAPPEALAPGVHSVTVKWTPNSRSERLRWRLEPTFADDWAAIATRPAHEYLETRLDRCGANDRA